MKESKIRVKKPFEFFDEEEKEIEQEQHIEREEKPVADDIRQASEDYHGGEESTESLPNTPSPSDEDQSSDDETSETTSSEATESEADANQQSQQQNGSNNSSHQSQQSSESNAEESDRSENSSENCEKNEETQQSSNESNNDQQAEQSSKENNEESNEEESENAESSENAENESSASEESDNEENSDNESEESEYDEEDSYDEEEAEDSEDEEEDDYSENSDEQQYSHQYNTQQVVDLISSRKATIKFYQTEFYRFIETIAEERLKVYDYHDFDEYNIKKLMFRQFEKKSLNHYRMSRVRDSVVLILDNSGSMLWWATNLQILANLALARGDIELYIAPNGYIEEKVVASGRIRIRHKTVMQQLRGRKIIYVGDFDGANTPIILSRDNDVIWVCPESRYRYFKSHNWVHYDESEFKGVFIRAYTIEEMFNAFKRVNRLYRLFIDLHENDKFDDDWR